ncbi:hypothetical protein MMC26_003307 [Xylographa opegraphella]|nr:hypothetical protein [Xylographa opegraphella]
MAPLLVDIHTHIYPPSYIALLSARTTTPYIAQPPPPTPTSPLPPPRLIILPSDDDASIPPSARGRPIDASYSSVAAKLAFMEQHSIAASVVSLANPWLDFLPASAAAAAARAVNDDMHALCAAHPRRLFALGALPVSAPAPALVAEVHRLAGLPLVRGCILGTTGLGAGLDDPALDSLWGALEATQLLAFIHPHYGLPKEVFGPRAAESGHVLPLALGFPLETTVAFVRMYLAGVFERFPRLRVLLAHAGGAVPFLAGRVESCVRHERVGGQGRGKKDVWGVLRRNVWLDGVVYSAVGLKAAVEAVGRERVLWGTDHPFFPPVGEEEEGEGGEGEGGWLSVRMNVEAVEGAFRGDRAGAEGVLGGNAVRLLGLELEEREVGKGGGVGEEDGEKSEDDGVEEVALY